MRESVLEYLCCPSCQGDLAMAVDERAGVHVMRGALACVKCGARARIVEGVPDFVTDPDVRRDELVEQTTNGFAVNWKRYSNVIMAQPALNDELFRGWIAPLQPESFGGRVVLDAGCGMGRWLAAAAPHGATPLIGFDYSEIAHAAFANTRHLKSVHVVRADIFRLPFKPVFDICYSLGVIHHTPNPEGAFAALLDVVKAEGVLAVWVYGKENNEWIERFVSPLRRLITSRMPDAALYALSKVLSLQLAAAAHGYARVFPTPTSFSYDAYTRHLIKYPREYLEHIVYDHLVPQLAQYLPRDEVEGWAKSRALPHSLTSRNANSWRLIAARSQEVLRSFTEAAA
jgi:SAM-dependent methyltransferase